MNHKEETPLAGDFEPTCGYLSVESIKKYIYIIIIFIISSRLVTKPWKYLQNMEGGYQVD